MLKQVFISGCILTSFVSFAQEKALSCSETKSKKTQLKSNTLSIDQIARTEKYDVHFYQLDLSMTNLNTNIEDASTTVIASARVDLDSALIELHQNFVISEIQVNDQVVSYKRQATALIIPVNATSGQQFKLKINYSGTPATAATNPLGGGGMTNATSQRWGEKVTWSLSEPYSAFEWFAVKQSLRDKIDSCAVNITVPSTCKGGSNGVLKQVVDLGNGTHRFEWKHNHPIDYYLISVAIAEYIEYNVTANPINSQPVLIQNFIYDNPATLVEFKDDIEETADFIEVFAKKFGPYPFANEKYGHCMAPLGGGMEHQTMTTQGLFDKELTSHELGHQWWGDHVTCASWSDIWVNEGFATYSVYVMMEDLYPNEKAQYIQDQHNNVMSQPDGSIWVKDSLNTNRVFNSRLTYDKGSSIIHTLRYLINDDAKFFQGLQLYQTRFADSTAIAVDFKNVMEEITGMNFDAFFEQWYFGEGYPTYSAKWNQIDGDLLLEINESVSANAITPLFTTDLEVLFSRQGKADTTLRLPITAKKNQFLIKGLGQLLTLKALDPSNDIINMTGSISKNPNFVAGVDDAVENEIVTIYPNPSNGPITIKMGETGTYQYTLVDTRGRVIQSASFDTQTEINLSDKPVGTYLVQITNDNGLSTSKLVHKN